MAEFKRKRTTGSEGDALTLGAHITATDPHPYSDYITYEQALDLLGGGGGGGGTSSAELTAHNESTASHAKLMALLTPKTAFDAFAAEANLQLTNCVDSINNHTKAATERHQSKHLGHDGNELYAWWDHSHIPGEIGAATAQHTHEGVYSVVSHGHDARYALLTHDHGAMYISNAELEQAGIYPSVYKHPGVLNPDYHQITTFENIGMELPEQMITNGMYVYAMNDDIWYQATVEEVEDPEDLDNPIRTIEWSEVLDPGIMEYNPLDLNEHTVQGNIYIVDPKNCPITGSVLINTYVTELTDDVYDGDLLILHGVSKVRQVCSQEGLIFSREANSYTDVVIENEGTDIETTLYTKRYTWTKWTSEIPGTRTSDVTSEFIFSNGQLIGTIECGESFVHSLQVYINNALRKDWFTNVAGTTGYEITFNEPIEVDDTFVVVLIEKLPSYTDIASVRNQLSTHSSNTTSHITSSERAKWNGKQDSIPSNTFAPNSHVGDTTHMTALEKSTIATGLSKIVEHDLTHLEESEIENVPASSSGYFKIGDLTIAYGSYIPVVEDEVSLGTVEDKSILNVSGGDDSISFVSMMRGVYTLHKSENMLSPTVYSRTDEVTGIVYGFVSVRLAGIMPIDWDFGIVNNDKTALTEKITMTHLDSITDNAPWVKSDESEESSVDIHYNTVGAVGYKLEWPVEFENKVLNAQVSLIGNYEHILKIGSINNAGCIVSFIDPFYMLPVAFTSSDTMVSYQVIGK